MLTAACSSCGRPARLSLALPEVLRCGCGFTGRPSADVEARLRAAQGALFHSDARRRQLSAKLAHALSNATAHRLRYLAASAIFVVPAAFFTLLFAGAWLLTVAEVGRVFLIPVVPFVAMVTVAAVGYRWLVARQRWLGQLVSARPPLFAGEPAACHVCGGEVARADVAAVVRCRYCAADNVVDPWALAQAHQREAHALGGIEGHVASREQAVSTASGAGLGFVLLAALSTPVIGVVTLVAMAFLNALVLDHLGPSSTPSYMVVPTGMGPCAGSFKRQGDGSIYVDFGAATIDGKMHTVVDPAKARGLSPVATRWFVGKKVRYPQWKPGEVAVVTGAVAGVLGDKLIMSANGQRRELLVAGLCLAP